MNRPIAVGLLVLCTALWGLAFVFQKGAMQHMEPLTFAGVRYFLGSFLVLPLADLGVPPAHRRRHRHHAARNGCASPSSASPSSSASGCSRRRC